MKGTWGKDKKTLPCLSFGCWDQKNYEQLDPKDDELFVYKSKSEEILMEDCISSNVQIDLQICE